MYAVVYEEREAHILAFAKKKIKYYHTCTLAFKVNMYTTRVFLSNETAYL